MLVDNMTGLVGHVTFTLGGAHLLSELGHSQDASPDELPRSQACGPYALCFYENLHPVMP